MKNLFFTSENLDLVEYVRLIVTDIWPNETWNFHEKFSKSLDLVVFNTEESKFKDFESYATSGVPVLLFSYETKPLLLHFTKKYYISGIISFDMSKEDIKNTFEAVFNGDIFYSHKMVSMLFSNKINDLSAAVLSLTDREIEILVMMMNDLNNEDIASELNVSVRTINAHKGNIMRKVGAKTTSGLIKTALDYSAVLKTQL